jgi:WD40 repeat protein
MGNADSRPFKTNESSRGGCCGFGDSDQQKTNIKDLDEISDAASWKSSEQGATIIKEVRESYASSGGYTLAVDAPQSLIYGSPSVNVEQHQQFANITDSEGENSLDEVSDGRSSDESESEDNNNVPSRPQSIQTIAENEKGTNLDIELECNEEDKSSSINSFLPKCKTLSGSTNWVEALATYGTKIFSAGVDEDIRIWDATTGTILMTLSGHDDVITSLAISNDGKHICSGSVDKTVRIWDVETGKQLSNMYGHEDYVMQVAYSNDDIYVASASVDKTIRLWNVFSSPHTCIHKFIGHTMTVDAVAFSPDGKYIISGGEDAMLRIWDPKTGECKNVIRGHTGWFYCVAYAPIKSGQPNYVCTGSHIGNVVDIWNVSERKLHQTMKGHTGPVLSIAYSPDGRYIASSGTDHTIRLWQVETGKCTAVLKGHKDIIGSVAFGSDGQHTVIVSGSRDWSVKMWYVKELCPNYFRTKQ